MKRILLFLSVALIAQFLHAQNVGIGTNTPNAKAILDISSTTKGLLIPSMTTSQRLAITSTPNGLMVYDTDKNEYYHYNGTSWKPILNGEYWSRPVTSRDRIANATDSVGIGLNSALERLDVNGNIRSRNNLLVDNNIDASGTIVATGTVQGGALVTGGNLVVAGTGGVSGDLTTNSDLIINNTTATIQLKSSNVNKGYFQLSGDNVRMGTNSGNSTGNLIIRMNGNDRVQINPSGDIDLDGKITRTAVTGNAPLLPVCMGQVSSGGSIINGTGNFTVVRVGTGNYQISSSQFVSTSILIVTPISGVSEFAAGYLSSGILEVIGLGNFSFSFIVYNLN